VSNVASAGFVKGIVLNKLDETATLGAYLDVANHAGLEQLLPVPLLRGGDVVENHLPLVEQLQLIHCWGQQLPGAKQVAANLWLGGDLEVAAKLLADEECSRRSKIWAVVGFAGWAPRQLDFELSRGVWVHARDTSPLADTGLRVLHSLGSSAAEELWASAMRATGLGCLARVPRDASSYRTLRALCEQHQHRQMQEFLDAARRKSTNES